MINDPKNGNKKHSIICIYAAYNIDDYDYEFIRNNMDDCTFIVIDSMNVPYRNGTRLKNMKGVLYRTRPNLGYDVTAWKEFILDNYEMIKSYEYVALVNNSCRYDFKITSALRDMASKNATFYGLNLCTLHVDHAQSYFIILHKSIVNSNAFYRHWLYMKPIETRDDAIWNHELTFTEDMLKNAGAVVATLTDDTFIGTGYEAARYHEGMGRLPPFLKKKIMHVGQTRSVYDRLLKKLPHMI